MSLHSVLFPPLQTNCYWSLRWLLSTRTRRTSTRTFLQRTRQLHKIWSADPSATFTFGRLQAVTSQPARPHPLIPQEAVGGNVNWMKIFVYACTGKFVTCNVQLTFRGTVVGRGCIQKCLYAGLSYTLWMTFIYRTVVQIAISYGSVYMHNRRAHQISSR